MKQNVSHINGGITINVDMSVKKHHICEKYYACNPATCNSENGKYLASIMDDSVIMCDAVIGSYDEEIKTIPTNLMKEI